MLFQFRMLKRTSNQSFREICTTVVKLKKYQPRQLALILEVVNQPLSIATVKVE